MFNCLKIERLKIFNKSLRFSTTLGGKFRFGFNALLSCRNFVNYLNKLNKENIKNLKISYSSSGSINMKFPTEEENLSNLLKEMNQDKNDITNKNLNNVINYIQKGNILFISDFNENSKINKLKLGQFILINKKIQAQCVSIREKMVTFLMINNVLL